MWKKRASSSLPSSSSSSRSGYVHIHTYVREIIIPQPVSPPSIPPPPLRPPETTERTNFFPDVAPLYEYFYCPPAHSTCQAHRAFSLCFICRLMASLGYTDGWLCECVCYCVSVCINVYQRLCTGANSGNLTPRGVERTLSE